MKSYFSLAAAVTGKAVTAVNRTVFGRFERNFGFFAAFSANRRIHLAFRTLAYNAKTLFACLTACRAAARFVGKAFGFIKFLFGSGKNKFFATFLAY